MSLFNEYLIIFEEFTIVKLHLQQQQKQDARQCIQPVQVAYLIK